MSNDPTRPSILIIDDEFLIQKSILRSLHRAYELSAASSAKEAFTAIDDEDFDLIICDLVMPECGGLEFHERLKSVNERMARRTVFMTGDTLDFEAKKLMEEREHDVLVKPFGVDDLEEFVSNALEARSQTRSSERRA